MLTPIQMVMMIILSITFSYRFIALVFIYLFARPAFGVLYTLNTVYLETIIHKRFLASPSRGLNVKMTKDIARE
jgi:hypothetical protein